MNESFDLPVSFKGETLSFPARLMQQGYTHKFLVDIYGQTVYFEPDEERNYRALIETEMVETSIKIDFELLKAVASAIEYIVK